MTFLQECIAFTGPVWERYIHHPWVEALFAGTLAEERFAYWLAQDLPYFGENFVNAAYPKVPPHNPWARLEMEYQARASSSRVERRLLDRYGDFALSRWAARPRREAFLNFLARTVYEGTFGEICAAHYACFCFCDTFGKRYLRERPLGLPDIQRDWVNQFNDEFFESHKNATEAGINEAGAHATPYERDRLRWIFLRGTQHQIGTFDAAWNLSDAWPGEGEERGVLAGAPPLAVGGA
jgi:thiaminase/transcriptional activator TenA